VTADQASGVVTFPNMTSVDPLTGNPETITCTADLGAGRVTVTSATTVFPAGSTTTVSCASTDAEGNSSPAVQFTVKRACIAGTIFLNGACRGEPLARAPVVAGPERPRPRACAASQARASARRPLTPIIPPASPTPHHTTPAPPAADCASLGPQQGGTVAGLISAGFTQYHQATYAVTMTETVLDAFFANANAANHKCVVYACGPANTGNLRTYAIGKTSDVS
jgi:hypothetical protein